MHYELLADEIGTDLLLFAGFEAGYNRAVGRSAKLSGEKFYAR